MGGFTLYAYTLGASAGLHYTSDKESAFQEAKDHRAFLVADPDYEVPNQTIVYQVVMRDITAEAIADVLNEHAQVIETFVESMEPIGSVE